MKKEAIIVLLLLAICSINIAFASIYEHYPNHFVTKYTVSHGSEIKPKIQDTVEITPISTSSLKYNTIAQLQLMIESRSEENCRTIKLSSGFNRRDNYNSESYHRECYRSENADNGPIKRYFFPEKTYAIYDNAGVPYWASES